ncbi:MAG: carboxypeptidase-like regulatory domain-containing protein [archaeon]
MATCKAWLVVIGIFLAIFIFQPVSAGSGPPNCQSPTVVDGYVYFANNTPVTGAAVAVTTTSGSCNSWADTTDGTGYYSIPGLEINGYTVTSTASISAFDGTNSSAVSGSTKRLNIFIRPTQPSLTSVSNRHNGTNIRLAWTSGSEASGVSIYDQLDPTTGSFSTTNSPKLINLSSFATYTWRARTCNTKVCSAVSSNSFSFFNTQPSAPVLNEIESSNASSLNLSWTSGTDSDTAPTDVLHDEFQLSYLYDFSTLLVNDSGASSPEEVNLQSLKMYYWRARTCDNTGASNACSSWASSSFFTHSCNVTCEAPPSCPSCSGGGGGGGSSVSFGGSVGSKAIPSYIVVLQVPPELGQGDSFAFLASFKATSDLRNFTLALDTPAGMTSKPAFVENYTANFEQNAIINGKISDNMPTGTYKFRLIVSANGAEVARTSFQITIKRKISGAYCGDSICDETESPATCLQDCHCGNAICESEFGEEATCLVDCQSKLAPFVFWVTALVLTLSILSFYVYRDLSHRTRELSSYIKTKLTRGESPEAIRKRLLSLGYSNKKIVEAYENIRKNYNEKVKIYNRKVAEMIRQKQTAAAKKLPKPQLPSAAEVAKLIRQQTQQPQAQARQQPQQQQQKPQQQR